MKNDSISRQAAIDALREEFKRVPTTAIRAKNVIEGLSSAQPEQPEIIRCKDCRHNPKETWFGCPMAHLSEKQRPETAWCWKGERKADKTD